MTNNNLKQALTGIMNEYARRFCEMYDFSEGWWVADDVLGVYCTDGIEVSISASDLAYCVDNEVDPDTFNEWWQYSLTSYKSTINIRSWHKGVRPDMLNI